MQNLAGTQHKVQVGMSIQRDRFKSICASVPSDQSLSFPLEETFNPLLLIEHPAIKDLSDCAGAQASSLSY